MDDISTVYTRNLNKTSDRRGYYDWKRSKDTEDLFKKGREIK